MRKLLLATAVSTAFAVPLLASAQTAPATPAEPASPHTVTGNLSVTSQYIFRGLSQTNGKPALQGGFDYSHASGFYAGTWLSNISWFTDQNAGFKSTPVALSSPASVGAPYVPSASNAASLEWDLYGGYRSTFGGGDWTYDVGILQYYYPGRYDNLGAYRNPNTTEIYGAIGYKWLTLKYSKGISTQTFGVNESKGADYLDLSASVPLGETGFTLLAHVGKQRYPGNPNVGYWSPSTGDNSYFDYTDYKLGVSKELLGFTYALAWTRANTKDTASNGENTAYMNAFGENIGGTRVAFSVSKTF